MSSDHHRWAHMTPMARNICSPPLLLIWPSKFLFHTIVMEGHYMLFSIEEFFKKVEQSCLTVVWQMTCQRSHICWCASC